MEIKELFDKIKLDKLDSFFDLLELKNINEIKQIIEENIRFEKSIFSRLGITPEQKKNLLENYPIDLYDYNKLITRYDVFERVILDSAYSKLDFNEIAELANKSKIKRTWIQYNDGTKEPIVSSQIDDILDNPEIEINIDRPEIIVTYESPLNRKVIFTPGNVEVTTIELQQ
jgi:hypothetical protein